MFSELKSDFKTLGLRFFDFKLLQGWPGSACSMSFFGFIAFLWPYLVGQLLTTFIVDSKFDDLMAEQLVELLLLDFPQFLVKLLPRLGQVNRVLFQQNPTLYSNADVISFVERILLVMQAVALGESSQLETLTVNALVKNCELLDETRNLGLSQTLPHFMALLVAGKNLILQKVFVSLEEGELLKQALPSDLAILSVFVELFRNHCSLFELSEYGMFCLC